MRLFFVLWGFLVWAFSFSVRGEGVENVLFLVSDDLKASVLGCYGDKVCETPHIDRLAERGMVFDRAYCQGTSCNPSRTSFMHGLYQGQRELNVGLHFRRAGIHSVRVGKIYHMLVPGDIIGGTHGRDIASTWDERLNSPGREAHTPGRYACFSLDDFRTTIENRESTRMKERVFVEVQYEGDGSDQPDYKTAVQGVEVMRRLKGEGKRFFMCLGFVRPHYPMVAPEQFFSPYDPEKLSLPHVPEGDLDDVPKLGMAGTTNANNGIGEKVINQKRMWASYYGATAFMDAQVGRVMQGLEELGLAETTAVVFTSDHGYHLGEHTFWQKSNLHEEVVRVPLIIDVPGKKAGRSGSVVELVDLFPTMAELAGIGVPEGLHGKSLVPVLDDPEVDVKKGAIAFNSGHLWRTKDWAFMRYRDGSEELYSMVEDPGQYRNLAMDAEQEERLVKLRGELDAALRAAGLKGSGKGR